MSFIADQIFTPVSIDVNGKSYNRNVSIFQLWMSTSDLIPKFRFFDQPEKSKFWFVYPNFDFSTNPKKWHFRLWSDFSKIRLTRKNEISNFIWDFDFLTLPNIRDLPLYFFRGYRRFSSSISSNWIVDCERFLVIFLFHYYLNLVCEHFRLLHETFYVLPCQYSLVRLYLIDPKGCLAGMRIL